MSTMENSVRLIGHVGQDPEIHIFPSGDKKANINLATNRVYQDAKGELIKETHWHKVVVLGKAAKVVEDFVKRGNLIGGQGRLTNRSYDASHGTKRYIAAVICLELLRLNTAGSSLPNPFDPEVGLESNECFRSRSLVPGGS